MKINATWHRSHKMPKNPTLTQRVNWHLAHSKYCACRPLGGKIREEIKKRGWKICSRGHAYKGSGPCPVCWPGRSKGRT